MGKGNNLWSGAKKGVGDKARGNLLSVAWLACTYCVDICLIPGTVKYLIAHLFAKMSLPALLRVKGKCPASSLLSLRVRGQACS